MTDYLIALLLLGIMVAAVVALIKLVKRIVPRYVYWEGRGSYEHEVEASSEYQPALFRLAGGEKRKGVAQDVVATLHLEDRNRFDPKAVRVSVNGRTVGYMSPADARSYRDRIRSAGHENVTGQCDAIIVGGRKKGIDSREHFGILLDLPTSTALKPRTAAKSR